MVSQAAAAAHEVVPVVPPADPPQRAHLPALQGQEPLAQPQEAQEEIVAHEPAPVRPHQVQRTRFRTFYIYHTFEANFIL